MSARYMCAAVGGFGETLPPPDARPQMTCGIYWLSAVEMSLLLIFDGECDSLSCWSHLISSTSVVSSIPERDSEKERNLSHVQKFTV